MVLEDTVLWDEALFTCNLRSTDIGRFQWLRRQNVAFANSLFSPVREA